VEFARVTEQQLHRAVARFLDLALPHDAWWTTIPAGGGGRVRGAQLKAMGYKAGTPDILIVYRGRALFIELKAPKVGRESPEQIAVGHRIIMAGAGRWLAWSLDDVERICGEHWNIPLRASARRAA
jgi:hypothetical protein